jgi:hypothetical protein
LSFIPGIESVLHMHNIVVNSLTIVRRMNG